MPKHVWKIWSQGPPPSAPWHEHLQQYTRKPSTWDANFTTRSPTRTPPKTAAKARSYIVCRDRGCSGWSYTDRNEASCRVCGTPFDGPEIPATSHAKVKVDREHFQKLAEDDPSRITLQKLIDGGHAAFDDHECDESEGDAFEACRKQLRLSTEALVKSQNLQNHVRSQARACREKLLKLEAEQAKAEEDFVAKAAEHDLVYKKFEAMSKASKETAAIALGVPAADLKPPSFDDTGRVAFLEQEVLRLSRMLEQCLGVAAAPPAPSAAVASTAVVAVVAQPAPANGEAAGKRRKVARQGDTDDEMGDPIVSATADAGTPEATAPAQRASASANGTEATLAAAKAAAEAAAALIANQAKNG